MTGMTAAQIMATGKVDRMIRVETNQEFGTENDPLSLRRWSSCRSRRESVNLIVSPLSAHLTNDTPGLFIQARRALKPTGYFSRRSPAPAHWPNCARPC